MKIAFILFKYFPFGGLQRDFLRIAKTCRDKGHEVVVYTLSWQGDKPTDFDIRELPIKALSNHKKYARFHTAVMESIKREPVDRIVGFNKMPDLDYYYAADPCYEQKARHSRGLLYRLGSRYRLFKDFEAATFGRGGKTQLLMISEVQKSIYQYFYHTEEERFHLLPPGISIDRKRAANADEIRISLREQFAIAADENLMLMVGSGFKTKGLDRALLAMASLPDSIKKKTHFIIIGQDNPKEFLAMARRLKLEKQVQILSGRDDVPHFMMAADLLIHPAYYENTGTVLLEAVVAGLPVLVSSVCGYAHYIQQAKAGLLLKEPYKQEDLNEKLLYMLTASDNKKKEWQKKALTFARDADIYSMPERAADIILGEGKTTEQREPV